MAPLQKRIPGSLAETEPAASKRPNYKRQIADKNRERDYSASNASFHLEVMENSNEKKILEISRKFLEMSRKFLEISRKFLEIPRIFLENRRNS